MTISSKSEDPLFVIVGATGSQGGSVIKALEASKKACRVRGFSRDAKSASARALTARGVEVMAVDVDQADDKVLTRCFEEGTYCFVNNFPMSHFLYLY